MSTVIQLRRGTAAEANALIGYEGELYLDLDNQVLRYHDGSTLGGHAIAGTDYNTDVVTSLAINGSLLQYTDEEGTVNNIDLTASLGIRSLVEDLTPELGGDIDVDSHTILTTGTEVKVGLSTGQSFLIQNSSTSTDILTVSETGELTSGYTKASTFETSGYLTLVDSTINSVSLSAADTTVSYSMKLPGAQGASGQVLVNDGNGDLYWADNLETLTSMTSTNGQNSFELTDDAIEVTGDIIPSADVTYDLGSPTNRFKDLHLSGSTINIGTNSIKSVNDQVLIGIPSGTYSLTKFVNFDTPEGTDLTFPITFDNPVGPFITQPEYYDQWGGPALVDITTSQDGNGYYYVDSVDSITDGGSYPTDYDHDQLGFGFQESFQPVDVLIYNIFIPTSVSGGVTFTDGHHTATFTSSNSETVTFEFDISNGDEVSNFTWSQSGPLARIDFEPYISDFNYRFRIESDDTVSFTNTTGSITVPFSSSARSPIDGTVNGDIPSIWIDQDANVEIPVANTNDLSNYTTFTDLNNNYYDIFTIDSLLTLKQKSIYSIPIPTSSIGSATDEPGDLVFDDNYVYGCFLPYDGTTNIWKRVAWSSDTW